MSESAGMATIWQVPDDLWAEIENVLGELDPPKRTGRPRVVSTACVRRHHISASLKLSVEPVAREVRGRRLCASHLPEVA